MFLLQSQPITTALSIAQAGNILRARTAPLRATLEAIFAYGSGGATVDAYVQTSLDGGTTFFDIAQFHLTTMTEQYAFNLSALTPVTTEYTPASGAMTANTCKDGLLGTVFQLLLKSSGTYAGNTTLSVYAVTDTPLTMGAGAGA